MSFKIAYRLCLFFYCLSFLTNFSIAYADSGSPLAVQQLGLEETEGVVEFVIADDFRSGRGKEYKAIHTDSGEILALKFSDSESSDKIEVGSRIRVKGIQNNGNLIVDSAAIQAVSKVPVQYEGVGEELEGGSNLMAVTAPTVKKVAFILFKFQNSSSSPPTTAASIQASAFSNPNSIKNYYNEVSYGKISIQGYLNPAAGDFFGWYTLPINTGGCNPSGNWVTLAQTAAATNGYNAANYDATFFVFPSQSACGFLGLAMGSPQSGAIILINGTYNFSSIASHEMGHALNMHHANSLNCGSVPISSTCFSNEYGDPFDVMGNAYSIYYHLNAAHKAEASFFDSANTINVTSSGIYTISPLESSTSNTQTLRIAADTDINTGQITHNYFVEFRQPYGFDNFPSTSSVVNGVIIHRKSVINFTRTQLLDLNSQTSTFDDAALLPGQTFTDPLVGISVHTLSVTPSGATVQVNFFSPTQCNFKKPVVSLNSSGPSAIAQGGAKTFQVTVTNKNSAICLPSVISVSPGGALDVSGYQTGLPAGWVAYPASLTGTLAPGASYTQTITLAAPITAASGSLPLTFVGSHATYPATGPTGSTNYGYDLVAIANGDVTVDTNSPIISITNPLNNSIVSGTINIHANATDDSGNPAVTLKVNGIPVLTDNYPPYDFPVVTNIVPNGQSYSLTATATDVAGNSATSAPILITVNNPPDTVPPLVSIQNPSVGPYSTYVTLNPGAIAVQAVATDNIGVKFVDFFLNGIWVARRIFPAFTSYYGPTYEVNGNTNWIAPGMYGLTAQACDFGDNCTTTPTTVIQIQ